MHLHAVTLLVPDYDTGIDFYVGGLGFLLQDDIRLSEVKRWVRVAPSEHSTSLLLARADTEAQLRAIGAQTGDRVGFFLQSDEFDTDHARLTQAGAVFEETPRHEPYGTVAVWRDPFGNRWDLIQFANR